MDEQRDGMEGEWVGEWSHSATEWKGVGRV